MSFPYIQNWDAATAGNSVNTVAGWTNVVGVMSIGTTSPDTAPNELNPTTLSGGIARCFYTGDGSTTNPIASVLCRATATGNTIIYLEGQTDDSVWYRASFSSNNNVLTLDKKSGGTTTTVGTGTIGTGNGAAFTPTAGTYYVLEIARTSAGVVRARVYPKGASPAGWDVSYTDPSPLAAGYPGLGGSATTIIFDTFTFNGDAPGLVGGTVTLSAFGSGTLTVTSTGPTGGTAPYSYQWQRSTSPTSGFANVSGATALTFADTGRTNGTYYYYRLVTTDSAGSPATVTSSVVAGKPTPDFKLLLVGDSWGVQTSPSGGTSAGDQLAAQLEIEFGGSFKATVSNQCVGGTSTNDWQPGGTNYNAAVAAAPPGTYPNVAIHLGINDSSTTFGYSDTTFKTKMTAVVNGFIASGYQTVYLFIPPFIGDISANHTTIGIAALVAYKDRLLEIAAANPTVVKVAVWSELDYFVNHQSVLGTDKVHPTQVGGGLVVATGWAKGISHAMTIPQASDVKTGVDRGDSVLGTYANAGGGGSSRPRTVYL